MRTQKKCLEYVSIVVDDYDEAIEYIQKNLGSCYRGYTSTGQALGCHFTKPRKRLSFVIIKSI